MSFARKMKRKNKPHTQPGWEHKKGYDTETHEFWINTINGKEKWIEKKRVDNG